MGDKQASLKPLWTALAQPAEAWTNKTRHTLSTARQRAATQVLNHFHEQIDPQRPLSAFRKDVKLRDEAFQMFKDVLLQNLGEAENVDGERLRAALEKLDSLFFTKALQLQQKNDTTRKRRMGGAEKAVKEQSRHPSLASLAPSAGEGVSESPTLENKPEAFSVWQKQEHVELQSPVHPPQMPFNGEGNGYMPQFQWEGQMVRHPLRATADKEEQPGFHIGHLTPAPDAMGNPTYAFPNMAQQSPHLLAALSPESPNLAHPGFFGHHNISRASTLPTEDPHNVHGMGTPQTIALNRLPSNAAEPRVSTPSLIGDSFLELDKLPQKSIEIIGHCSALYKHRRAPREMLHVIIDEPDVCRLLADVVSKSYEAMMKGE